MTKPAVTVIIPNYNGKHYLNDCIYSICNQTFEDFEVIIVDNASVDGSVEYIKTNFPQIKIIENSSNLGFSKAVNQGAKFSKAKYLAILNNDTIVDSKWLEEFISFTNEYNDFGACQSKILLYECTETVNTVGNEIFYLGQGWSGGYGQVADSYKNIKEVTYCSGASMFIRRDILERVGYFDDEEVFMYHDDLDLGWRLLILGYKNYLIPNSIVYHKYNYSRNHKKYYFVEVSRFVSIIKYYEMKTILLILPAMITLEVGIVLFSILNGWFLDKIKVYLYIISNFLRLLQKRRMIQGRRILSDREISDYFIGEINFKELNNFFLQLINPLFNLYWLTIKKII
jgi:GT2 family glycosyltransferase